MNIRYEHVWLSISMVCTANCVTFKRLTVYNNQHSKIHLLCDYCQPEQSNNLPWIFTSEIHRTIYLDIPSIFLSAVNWTISALLPKFLHYLSNNLSSIFIEQSVCNIHRTIFLHSSDISAIFIQQYFCNRTVYIEQYFRQNFIEQFVRQFSRKCTLLLFRGRPHFETCAHYKIRSVLNPQKIRSWQRSTSVSWFKIDSQWDWISGHKI